MSDTPEELQEDEDFYMERGCLVFTANYHRKRGYCCGSGCRHCPYGNGPGGAEKTVTAEEEHG
jgi:hypothetical protein